MDRTPARRRRGAALESAIFQAVREELAAVGYAGLSVTAVAERAGTSKPVLYRRWPSRARLVFAALTEEHRTIEEPPDTGSLRGDLIGFLNALARQSRALEPATIWGLLSDSAGDPELAEDVRATLAGPHEQRQVRLILRRAEERGELEPGRRPRRQLTLPADLLRAEFLLHGGISPAAVTRIVDDLLVPLFRSPETLSRPTRASSG